MKNIKLLFLAIVATVSFSSCGDDDEFYNSKSISIPGLIEIENEPNYEVGDVLYLNTNFSKLLTEPGQSAPLDIFKTTDGATSFSFYYGLEKRNPDNTWTAVNLENKMILDQGEVFDGDYSIGQAIFNPVTQTYQFRAGIPLQETGNYRIFFGLSDASHLELTSVNSSKRSIYLSIKTTANNLTDGFYNFTVE